MKILLQSRYVCGSCNHEMAIERMKPGKPALIVWCCYTPCSEVNHRYVVKLQEAEATPFEKYDIKPNEIRKGQRTYTT